MSERGIKKWAPFQNLPTNDFLKTILEKKEKIEKPTLSLEQTLLIEKKLIEAFYEQVEVTFTIYQKGCLKRITSIIVGLNSSYKTITLKENQKILFEQIINIEF